MIDRTHDLYDARRPHGSLDVMTPDQYYYQHLHALQQAA